MMSTHFGIVDKTGRIEQDELRIVAHVNGFGDAACRVNLAGCRAYLKSRNNALCIKDRIGLRDPTHPMIEKVIDKCGLASIRYANDCDFEKFLVSIWCRFCGG